MKIKDILGEADVTLKPMPGAQEVDIDGKAVGTATTPAAATAISDLAKKGEFTPAGDEQTTSEDQEDDANPRTKIIHALAHKMGWGVSDLELLKDHELVALYRKHGDIDEVQSPFPSRNPGTPAAADAAAQAAAPQTAHQSVMPSRNAPTREGHRDLIRQGNADVGGDATDRFIQQIKDTEFEKANKQGGGSGSRSPLSEKDELMKWLTIAGIR
jgi:hypothetical protein